MKATLKDGTVVEGTPAEVAEFMAAHERHSRPSSPRRAQYHHEPNCTGRSQYPMPCCLGGVYGSEESGLMTYYTEDLQLRMLVRHQIPA